MLHGTTICAWRNYKGATTRRSKTHLLSAMAMAKSSWVLVLFALLCAADAQGSGREERSEEEKSEGWLKPREPTSEFESEAGKIETWASHFPALRRAGFGAALITVNSGGLVLPMYSNSHAFKAMVEGSGIIGLVTEHDSFAQKNQFRINKCDVVVVPRGVAWWFYNDGQQPARLVDIANYGRDTDRFRNFQLLSGKAGFSPRVLSHAWNVSEETVRKLLNTRERQQRIIRVSRESMMREEGSVLNFGASDLIYRLDRNIPEAEARQGGKLWELNSKKMLALADLGMSARCLKLERRAMYAPNYIHNGDKVIYVVRGSADIEIVSNNGERVVAQRIKEGQLAFIPRGFPHVEVAADEGYETFAFMNTDRPSNSYFAGGNGLLNRLPRAILSSALGVSRDDVEKLLRQRGQDEAVIFPEIREQEEEHRGA